ncbi:MAG: hypothetical protein JXP34_02425 [Planctomycetes bacterium]|nr:hypothetical protein [Planctomycetota bacterium]
MSVETAELIFYPTAILLAIVWLAGVRFALASLRPPRRREEERAFSPAAEIDPDAIEGDLVIEGEPEALARRLASQLAGSFAGAGSAVFPAKVTECTAERVTFERTPGGGRSGLFSFDGGIVTFHREGERIRVRYAVSLRRSRRLFRILAYLVCFLYGGLFVIGCPILIWTLVLPSEDPGVRAQVIQTLQMVHGVWPPFLIGFVASRVRKMTAAYFETLLANLPYAA